jgi:hypothetical protein
MKCILCEQRKAKRYCPAKKTQICPVCCGEKRGVEINCPLDCPYYVEGQKYQQEKVTRQRIKKEGVETYIRRAELYNRSPEIFSELELVFVDLFHAYDIKDGDLISALELVLKTIDTEKKGILYEYKAESRIVNEVAGRVLTVLRRHKDMPELRRGRITLDYSKHVVEEFLKEAKFYMEMDSNNPQSYLTYISRCHPERKGTTQRGSSLFITS